jgi:hypothetical protein
MATETPQKTGFPLLIDTDLSNTLDFHIASTDFINVIDEYANHIAAYYVWNHRGHTVDPISSQAQFFQELNDTALNLISNTEGGEDDKVQGIGTGLFYHSKINHLLAKTEIWIRGEDNLPEKKEEGGTISYHALDLLSGDDHWKEYTEDTYQITIDKLQKLQDGWGMQSIDDQFKLYWYDKFLRSHKKLKEEYSKLVTVDTLDYFTQLSDCIGLLARSSNHVTGVEIPIIDVDFTMLGEIPDVTHPYTDDKLDIETRVLIEEMSAKTNCLFRQNLVHTINLVGAASSAHGEDLVTDYEHWIRMLSVHGNLNSTVAETIGVAYDILQYIQTAENKQKIHSPVFSMVVEDSIIKVDFLKDKVKSLIKLSPTNDDVLKSREITTDLS